MEIIWLTFTVYCKFCCQQNEASVCNKYLKWIKKVLWKYANISGSVVVALVRISHFKMSDFSRKMYGYGVFSSEKNFVLSIYSWHNITCNYTVSTGNIKKDWKIQTLWQLCESTPARCRGSQSLKWDIWERETRYMNMKYNWNIESWDTFSANSERKTRRWGTWHVIRQYNSHML